MNWERVLDILAITSMVLFLFLCIIIAIFLIKNKNNRTEKLHKKLSKIIGFFFLMLAILYTIQVFLAIHLNMPTRVIILNSYSFIVSLSIGIYAIQE